MILLCIDITPTPSVTVELKVALALSLTIEVLFTASHAVLEISVLVPVLLLLGHVRAITCPMRSGAAAIPAILLKH